MKQMHITETVLRDAQQSLIATRMPFEDFEGILDEMDQAGYHSIECWGGATFDSCLRYLHEDPWERLRKIKSPAEEIISACRCCCAVRTCSAITIIRMIPCAVLSARASRTAWISSVFLMR